MDLFFPSHIWKFRCSSPHFRLSFVWVLGLFSGALCSRYARISYLRQLPALFAESQQLFPVLVFQLMFLGVSVVLIYVRAEIPLYALIFFRGFFHVFLGCGILRICGTSGWLVWGLVYFGEWISVPVLWLYWLQAARSREGTVISVIPAVCAIFLGICFDYSVISPFLTYILSL